MRGRRVAPCAVRGAGGVLQRGKSSSANLLPEQTEKREAKTAREIFELPVRVVSSTRRSDLVNLNTS